MTKTKEPQSFNSITANPLFPKVQDISPKEVNEKKNLIHIIDVRRPDEFCGELEHIPGAKLITLDTLEENQSSLPKDGSIVFICRSGGRSAHASVWAQDNGWQNVYNMLGGMIAWNKQKFETEV